VEGRTFTERDTASSPPVAVVDQTFVRRFYPGEDPLGKRFGLSLPGHRNDYAIVGVVKDAKYRSPAAVQSPMYFLPFNQTIQYEPSGYRRLENGTQYAQSIQLRVSGVPEWYEDKLRSALAGINPDLPVTSVKSYSEQLAIQFNQERLLARLTTLFSLLSLLLASVGLYGVTAYNVTRRTREIGVRMALGADRGAVVRMVLGSALLQVGIGLCIGIPLAIVCGRYLAQQLYAVGRFDLFVLGEATMVLGICAFVAGLVPACRAASIEPVTALRIE
jgi:macrolide transport system ATP-binding/permease protein